MNNKVTKQSEAQEAQREREFAALRQMRRGESVMLNEGTVDEWVGTWGEVFEPSWENIQEALVSVGYYAASLGDHGDLTLRLSSTTKALVHVMFHHEPIPLGYPQEWADGALAAMLDYDEGEIIHQVLGCTETGYAHGEREHGHVIIEARRCTLKRWGSFGVRAEVINYTDAPTLVAEFPEFLIENAFNFGRERGTR